MQRLLSIIIRLLAHLPFSWLRVLGRFAGYLLILSRSRIYRTSVRNIQFCLDLKPSQVKKLARKSCLHTGMTATEAFWIWCRPLSHIQPRLLRTTGLELIEKRIKQGRGVLLTGAHQGNWELITLWIGLHFPCAALYRKPKIETLDRMIRQGREKTGARLLSGEAKTLRQVLQHLNQGKVFVLLSDQEPSKGAGVFVPFFNHLALTMTLPKRLIESTKADVLSFQVLRCQGGFELIIQELPKLEPRLSTEAFGQTLNQYLEQLVMSDPAQFQWGYKRFKSRPDGQEDWYPF